MTRQTAFWRALSVLCIALAGSALAPSSLSADARHAKLPDALSHVPSIRSIYPGLWKLEMARKDGVSWERLRRGARELWMLSHPCSTATLERRYRRGARSSWDTMRAVWACDGVPSGHRAFMECIPAYEGGYGAPDVRFGGATGDPSGHGNVVMGHLQLRPAWYHGAMNGRPGTYGRDSWTPDLYGWASDPVNQARATAPIGRDQYATAGLCS